MNTSSVTNAVNKSISVLSQLVASDHEQEQETQGHKTQDDQRGNPKHEVHRSAPLASAGKDNANDPSQNPYQDHEMAAATNSLLVFGESPG